MRGSGPFVLEIPALTHIRPDRSAAVEAIFDMLKDGWKPPGDLERR
jgi:hypothetical protein